MTAPAARLSRRWLSSTVALAATGCASLLGLGPPPHLYRVTPKSTYPANLPRPSGQLLVDVPLAPAGLDTGRIALSRSACLDRLFRGFGMDRSGPSAGPDRTARFVREQQGDHRDRPRIGRIAGGSHFEDRHPAFRGVVQLVATGHPKCGWQSAPGWLIPPAAMWWRMPLSNAVSKPRATTSHRSSSPSTRRWEVLWRTSCCGLCVIPLCRRSGIRYDDHLSFTEVVAWRARTVENASS